ncbi:MAG: BTAD domain-containing putative transcriptional regulator [Anaerolineales bacterium]|jgi:DNA-binding SARP family transcriptional activator/predicted ATPase
MANLSICLLGPTRIKLGEDGLEVKPRKALALLIYLAVTAERQSRDSLATMLWPNSGQPEARHSLRNRLSELNLTLGNDWIEANRESVGLRTGFWLDVTQFRHYLAEAAIDPQPLIAAADLYRDDFLTGFTLPDCPEFDEWQFFQTEGLHQDLASALERLVGLLTSRADYNTAIAHARRWVALDPLHEPAHYQLMQLYVRTGQQAAAMRQFELIRQTLADELGLSPSRETTALYNDIQARKVVGRTPKPRPHHNLPIQTTTFIGREAELEDIHHLLLDEPDCRLLTLVGPGGIGKTRLALAVAAQMLEAFSDGVYFVPLEPVSELASIVPAMAENLNFTYYGKTEAKALLLDYLHFKKLLLVVDNFEHLLEGTNLLSEIMRHAAGVTLLVTSRARLNLQEEWVYEPRGLPFPDSQEQTAEVSESSAVLERYSAMRLFLHRARQVKTGFIPSAAELASIAQICQLVEGMPLALELAASWIKVLNCHEIAVEIEQSLDFLTTPLHNVPERHRSLRVIFEQTWERLSQAEQTVLMKLSVFRGGCTREAAKQVTRATLPVLSSLVDKSLLRRTNLGRYVLHALLRQFAEEKLLASLTDHERTLRQFCAYYAALVHGYELEHKHYLASTAGNMSNFLSDWRNIQVAWRQALSYPLISEIGQFAYFLSLFYEFRGLIHEGEETFGLALTQLRSRAEPVSPVVLMRVLTHYGYFCLSLSRLKQARKLLEAARALSLTLDDDVHTADTGLTLHFLVWVARLQEQPNKARELLLQSMETCQRDDYQMGVWMCTAMRGEIEEDSGNYEIARQYFGQALLLSENSQFLLGTLISLALLGSVYSALADYAKAAHYLRRGLVLNRDLLLNAPLFTVLIGIAALFGRQGQPNLALELSAIILYHPQCNIVAQHKSRKMISELRAYIPDEEIKIVMHKAKRGQLSNPYIDPNFTVEAKFVDQLLDLIDRAVDTQ